jgi:phosphoglycerate dehydrogenase-like enzyme
MASPTVLVTEVEYRKAEPVFAGSAGLNCTPAPASEDELAQAVRDRGARHVVVGIQPYRKALYEALGPGSVIARFGVGHDGIDKVFATARSILCTNTPHVLDQSVAEHTILLIASAARHLMTVTSEMRRAQWSPHVGSELSAKTLVLIGTGPISQAVAKIAAFGYGMQVVGVARTRRKIVGFHTVTDDVNEPLASADYVSLHIPATPSNAHYLNAARLERFPRHAWLINTARGAVVDEHALYDALAERRIGGAALDVFEREPYSPIGTTHDLRTLPNVILTPHVGSSTFEANRRMALRALENIRLAEARQYDHMDLLNPSETTKSPATL